MEQANAKPQTLKEWAHDHCISLPTAYTIAKQEDFPAARTSPRGKYLIDVLEAEKWLRTQKMQRRNANAE